MTLPKAAPDPCRNHISPQQPLGFYEFAQRNPDKVALVLDDAQVRYADLAGQVHQVSRALRTLGFARGDVLAAVLRNGRICLPYNWRPSRLASTSRQSTGT